MLTCILRVASLKLNWHLHCLFQVDNFISLYYKLSISLILPEMTAALQCFTDLLQPCCGHILLTSREIFNFFYVCRDDMPD